MPNPKLRTLTLTLTKATTPIDPAMLPAIRSSLLSNFLSSLLHRILSSLLPCSRSSLPLHHLRPLGLLNMLPCSWLAKHRDPTKMGGQRHG